MTKWVRRLVMFIMVAGSSACVDKEKFIDLSELCDGVSALNDQLTVCAQAPAGEAQSIGTLVVRIDDGTKTQVINLERDGSLENVWLFPHPDNYPVIVLSTRSVGSGSYASLLRLNRVEDLYVESEMPDLSDEQRQGYMGHDRFDVLDGQLNRYFPLYLPGDTNINPAGNEICFRYNFFREEWVPCSVRIYTGE